MMKQSRIEEDITGEIEASDFKERISEDFFKKNEYNCIICGDLPAETKIYELRKFLDKFGQIQYFWLEDENGEGNRQALIFFQTQEEMENAVKLQSQYFNSSFISVGRSNLLEHTNTKVKNDSITIMKNILLSDEIRNQKRKPHQFYSDSKRDGVIFQVYQNCFIHFDSYEMKNCAAIVLGVLLRTQELDQNMKQSLIYHLNTMIFDVNNAQQVANALDMLCGLALQTGMIIS
ncbi:MAG: hypothetical protein EZS28_006525 [Streblomastix strix]|uniref:RRM domain-containing protein n=1 Tax=Streblomastix strix TaxID=222440 RepID=A0A5J4WU53_9EUKA|nr:MAG: hypothetical protein EZS28_006525 [Streblomastix strix]